MKEYGCSSMPQPVPQPVISVHDAEQFLSSNHLFLTILESIQDGVAVLDAELNIKYMNSAMKEWYSGGADVINKKCFAIFHERENACNDCPSLQSLHTKRPHVNLVRYFKKGYNYGWQQLYAVPVLDDTGSVALIIEYIRDVTFQKAMEENFQDLEQRFTALEQQNKLLLNVLAERDRHQEELISTVEENVQRFIKPALNYLKKSARAEDISMVSSIIDEATYPLTKKRPAAISLLTPKELRVAALIKQGNTSKEIAAQLCVTKKAVDFHRTNIRKKLGLSRNDNLQTYLESHL